MSVLDSERANGSVTHFPGTLSISNNSFSKNIRGPFKPKTSLLCCGGRFSSDNTSLLFFPEYFKVPDVLLTQGYSIQISVGNILILNILKSMKISSVVTDSVPGFVSGISLWLCLTSLHVLSE